MIIIDTTQSGIVIALVLLFVLMVSDVFYEEDVNAESDYIIETVDFDV